MAHTKFTFTFPTGVAGGRVTFNADTYDDPQVNRPTRGELDLREPRTRDGVTFTDPWIIVYSDASSLTATTNDAAGNPLTATATTGSPVAAGPAAGGGTTPGSQPSAASVVAPDWQPSTAYKAKQLVWQAGQLYRAKAAFTSGASFSSTNWDAVGNGASTTLTPTATKTAAYTAVVGDLAMMNVAGGGTALTLPTAPADKAQVGYRAIGATAAVPLTVTAGGTNTIGLSGAATTTIGLADETVVLQYQATGTRWIAVANVKTQASLFTESIETFAASGSAITLGDPVTTGTMKDVTLTANCTITLPTPVAGKSFLLRLTQDATGGRTVTFVLPGGGSPKWGASGIAPALTVTAGAQDEIAFHSWGSWTGGLANKDIR